MKPVLLATDFSAAARNAGDHAAQLARSLGTELIVFHCWSLPVMNGESIALPVTINELEKANAKRTEEEAQYYRDKWNVKTQGMQSAGFAAEEIEECAKKTGAGMIVMGLEHAVAGKFFGSVSSVYSKNASRPVMIVPIGAEFHEPKNILLATDLNTHEHWHELNSLKEFAKHFGSTVNIVNVSPDLAETRTEHGVAGMKLDSYLKNVPHQWHFENDEVVNAISNKANEVNANVVAVVHHHLPWYRKVFHHSISREMTFATDRPLLILPEKVTHLKD